MKLLTLTLISLLSFSSTQLSATASQHAAAIATDQTTCNRDLLTPQEHTGMNALTEYDPVLRLIKKI